MAALARAAERLAAAGTETPRAEADLLLAHVLGCGRDRLYMERERRLSPAETAAFSALVARRARREPFAYLTGRREFLGRDFVVSPAVLIPRPETEELALAALADCRRYHRPRLLDLGTGSGVIAISLKLACPEAEATGTDISAPALSLAAQNGARLGAAVLWLEGDLLAPVAGEVFDLVIANPPYLSAQEYAASAPELRYEPPAALVAPGAGLEFYRRLARTAAAALAPNGVLWLEIGATQGAAVRALFTAAGWRIEIRRDLAGRDRLARAVPAPPF
ncbi:MAG: peptide chain release factor N(5)-glutamine methyltransferase [Gracilibacteraceae bacterium]|jgi:release factor glutamine methyltransferase|nr:peptide chain release factor N(5)-glutamine methyltransferase [Gracilibacteraceae bacterium]